MSPERRSAYAARLWWRRFAPRDVGRGGSPNRLGDWGQSPLPEISKERSALSLGTDFAGIYIQVFGNKSAENSGRYNI